MPCSRLIRPDSITLVALSVPWGRPLFREEDETTCDELIWSTWANGLRSALSFLADLRIFTSCVAVGFSAISH